MIILNVNRMALAWQHTHIYGLCLPLLVYINQCRVVSKTRNRSQYRGRYDSGPSLQVYKPANPWLMLSQQLCHLVRSHEWRQWKYMAAAAPVHRSIQSIDSAYERANTAGKTYYVLCVWRIAVDWLRVCGKHVYCVCKVRLRILPPYVLHKCAARWSYISNWNFAWLNWPWKEKTTYVTLQNGIYLATKPVEMYLI